MSVVCFALSAIMGYLLGMINPAYLLGRRKGIDIRSRGTQNAGTTNAILTLGFLTGLLVMVLDIFKMILALFLVQKLFPDQQGVILFSGLGVLLGHCFPAILGFRGGKGIASYFGMVVYLLPPAAMLISFPVYWISSGILYFVLKKRKYVSAVAPLIGTLYFILFASDAWIRATGILCGVVLCACNVYQANSPSQA